MKEEPVISSEDMDLEQAKLYARDLGELYRAERKKGEELAEEKLVLEYKLHELEALNKLFQSHLEQRFEVLEIYDELLKELKNLLREKLSPALREKLKSIVSRAESSRSEVAKASLKVEESG